MHYCCWPCVCDVQDFVKVDTYTVDTKNGPEVMHFAVIGAALGPHHLPVLFFGANDHNVVRAYGYNDQMSMRYHGRPPGLRDRGPVRAP